MIAQDVISHEAVKLDDLQPLATASGPSLRPDGRWTGEQHEHGKVLLLLEGVSGIVVALVAVGSPTLPDSTLVYLVAAWALITGGFEIAAGVRLRRYVTGELLLALSGVASLLLGALMAVLPFNDVPSMTPWLGMYGFVFGLLLLALGFRMRSWIKLPAVSSS
jgi:uncharacterized membrane protein HdeD (DUF308 family)